MKYVAIVPIALCKGTKKKVKSEACRVKNLLPSPFFLTYIKKKTGRTFRHSQSLLIFVC